MGKCYDNGRKLSMEKGRRQSSRRVSQASPQRISSLKSSETSPLPWLLTDSYTLFGLVSALMGLLRKEWKMVAVVYIRYPDGDTASLTVPSVFQRLSWNTGHLHSCRAPVREWQTDSLSALQACNSADLDQTHTSLAKLTAQFSVSLQWVHAHVGLTRNQRSDRLAKSAVRLCRHRTLSPTERPRHFYTLGSMETGRKTMVDTRHTLTQFGDWSGPSWQLSSACAQGTVDWVRIWRGSAFQTLPGPDAWLVLWHQLDRLLKERKKKKS